MAVVSHVTGGVRLGSRPRNLERVFGVAHVTGSARLFVPRNQERVSGHPAWPVLLICVEGRGVNFQRVGPTNVLKNSLGIDLGSTILPWC